MNVKYMIGLKCKKVSRPKKSQPKPFKSGSKVNTIKGLVINPNTQQPAFTFVEDESYMDCRSVILLDDNGKEIHQNDIERQRLVHKRRLNKNNSDLERFKKEISEAIDSMSDEELLENFPGWEIIKPDEYYDGELYDADPECKHVLDPGCYNGIKCLKCSGWYCL